MIWEPGIPGTFEEHMTERGYHRLRVSIIMLSDVAAPISTAGEPFVSYYKTVSRCVLSALRMKSRSSFLGEDIREKRSGTVVRKYRLRSYDSCEGVF